MFESQKRMKEYLLTIFGAPLSHKTLSIIGICLLFQHVYSIKCENRPEIKHSIKINRL